VTGKGHNGVEKETLPELSRREQLLSLNGLGGTGCSCSSPPGQEHLADGLCGSASSSTPPETPFALLSAAQA